MCYDSRVTASPRTLTSLLGNSQRLDGGAMFGNAPRTVWQAWAPPDDQHRIALACRALLVEEPGRRVLLEAGIGAFFPPPLRDRYGVAESHHVLLDSLAAHGLGANDIDVIVLSHLHFDHAGGLLSAYAEGQAPTLAFPRASYVISEAAWQRAKAPHARDRASFIPDLLPLLEATGRVERVSDSYSHVLGDGYRLHYSEGHTPGLLLTEVQLPSGPVVFASDLIPGKPWVHVPITMGYDRFPERLIEEKSLLLSDLLARGGKLFFTHDPQIAMGAVARDDKGRFSTRDDHAAIVRWS